MQRGVSANDLRERLRGNQTPVLPPRLCKVCSRASFLKCMECSTIYCSSKCQIKDWEEHQRKHLKDAKSKEDSYRPPSPTRPKRTSVQGRLKAAVNKETPRNVRESQETTKSIETTMEVDDITSGLQAVAVSDRTHPISREVDESFIEKSLRSVRVNRKFKQHIELDKDFMDNEGFTLVKVTNMGKEEEGLNLFHVVPFFAKNSFEVYKQALDEVYESDDVESIPLDQLEKFKSHLVMAKNGNHWSRARILKISNVVELEDIDSGKKFTSKDQIKIPKDEELIRPAYAIKIMFTNVTGEEEIEVGDNVKIKITEPNTFYVNWGEVKFETDEAPVVKENWTRHSIENIQVKDFHTGPSIKLLYCDGSFLEEGKLHVCESNKENWAFYAKLDKEIQEYVKENPSATRYKPVVKEMVLAKFTDGNFYRGVCLEASGKQIKVCLIDYGSIVVVEPEKVMAMPAKFLYTCCSHTVLLRLKSGRSVTEIDAEETREFLMEKNEFLADVKKDGNRYVITIEDSLVVFNKINYFK